MTHNGNLPIDPHDRYRCSAIRLPSRDSEIDRAPIKIRWGLTGESIKNAHRCRRRNQDLSRIHAKIYPDSDPTIVLRLMVAPLAL
jgi:hypothetical protein